LNISADNKNKKYEPVADFHTEKAAYIKNDVLITFTTVNFVFYNYVRGYLFSRLSLLFRPILFIFVNKNM